MVEAAIAPPLLTGILIFLRSLLAMTLPLQGCLRLWIPVGLGISPVRSEVNSEMNFSPNFEGLVLGCIDADVCK